MPGSTAPLEKFDPLALSTVGSKETFNWFRAAELKHGRCAMLAVTGYLVQAAGIHFPGMLSSEISFESLSGLNPFDQWAAVPDAGTCDVVPSLAVRNCRDFRTATRVSVSLFSFRCVCLIIGKWQIIGTIFVAEIASEVKKPHYFNGGELPTMVFPPIDFSGVKPETLKVKRDRELNNGRLAMISIMAFIAEYSIPGAVPPISGIAPFH